MKQLAAKVIIVVALAISGLLHPLAVRAQTPSPVIPAGSACALPAGASAPTLTVASTTVPPSTHMVISGTGWGPDAKPQIDIESRENAFNMFVIQAGPDGTFAVAVTADSVPGRMLIAATCGTSQQSLSITVAIPASPVPTLAPTATPIPLGPSPAPAPPTGFPWWLVVLILIVILSWIAYREYRRRRAADGGADEHPDHL